MRGKTKKSHAQMIHIMIRMTVGVLSAMLKSNNIQSGSVSATKKASHLRCEGRRSGFMTR